MNFKIHKDYFFRILGLNSLSIILKIIMGVVSTKLVSIYIGLNGISILEYFRNFATLAESVSQLGLQNGITKEISNCEKTEHEKRIFSTGIVLSGASTMIVILLCMIFNRAIQIYLFQSYVFEKCFFIFLLCLPSTTLQMLIISILNGKQFLKKIIWINSIGYFTNIILSIILITQLGLQGTMLQIALSPLLLATFTWIYAKKSLPNIIFSFHYFDKNIARVLLGFTLMNLVSATLTPFSLIYIRNLVETHLGTTEAGIWSSIIRLSGFYMLFVSSICSLYFFPRLSKNENLYEQRRIFKEYYKKFIPIIGIGLFLCYIFQDMIIKILFTKDFLILNQYFYLQLIIDFIKSCALIFGYNIIAERKIGSFILYECISIGSQILLSYLCIENWGLYGVFFANIISISLYLIGVVAYTFRKKPLH